MAEKVTTMVLTVVNLHCCKCYKKVMKVLCKFPEIQDQVYDEKNNKVTIKVVCCSPEKIRNKILCKGGGSIKSIEIVKLLQSDKTDELKKTSDEFKKTSVELKKTSVDFQMTSDEFEKTSDEFKKTSKEFKRTSEELKRTSEELKNTSKELKNTSEPRCHSLMWHIPVGFCCSDCYMGRPGGGPCYNPCYGQPVRYYDVHCGIRPLYCSWGGGGGGCGDDGEIRPVYDSWDGGGGGGYRCYSPSNRCSEYYFEENSQGCTIM